MTVQAELENRIARERRKLADLRNEIVRREAFIQGLSEALKMLPADISSIQQSVAEPLRAGSDIRRAQQLLSVATGPLHVSGILKGIGKEDTKQNRASLTSSLARYARKGEIFQREGPNMFSLIAIGSTEEIATVNEGHIGEAQLPPFFGTDR